MENTNNRTLSPPNCSADPSPAAEKWLSRKGTACGRRGCLSRNSCTGGKTAPKGTQGSACPLTLKGEVEKAKTRSYFQEHLEAVPEKQLECDEEGKDRVQRALGAPKSTPGGISGAEILQKSLCER